MLASSSGGDVTTATATPQLVQWNRTVAKGLQLAPLLVSCGLPKPAKARMQAASSVKIHQCPSNSKFFLQALLSDSRATSAVVEGQDPVPEPTFNPAAPEYNVRAAAHSPHTHLQLCTLERRGCRHILHMALVLQQQT
jgi:hypothetical protein